jgi:hypothetical protein
MGSRVRRRRVASMGGSVSSMCSRSTHGCIVRAFLRAESTAERHSERRANPGKNPGIDLKCYLQKNMQREMHSRWQSQKAWASAAEPASCRGIHQRCASRGSSSDSSLHAIPGARGRKNREFSDQLPRVPAKVMGVASGPGNGGCA